MGSLAEDFFEGLRQGLRLEGEKMMTAFQNEIDEAGITNRGRLRQGFEQQMAAAGQDMVLQITGVRYANYVTEGTDPGYWPPTAPIKRWVETKIQPPENEKWKRIMGTKKSIHDRGTPAPTSPIAGKNDYVQAALDRRLPKVTDTLERKAAEAAR